MESKVLDPVQTVFIAEPCLSEASATDVNTNTSLLSKVKSEDFEKRMSACENEGGPGFSTAQIKVEYVANEDYENRMPVLTSRNVQNAVSEDESGSLVPKFEILTNEKQFFDHSVSVTSNEAQNNKSVKTEDFKRSMSPCENDESQGFSTEQIKVEYVASEDDYENKMSVLTSRNDQNAENGDKSGSLVLKFETNEEQSFEHSESVTPDEVEINKTEHQCVDSEEESSVNKCFFCNKDVYLTLDGKCEELELGSKSVLEITFEPYRHSLKYSELDKKLKSLDSLYHYHRMCHRQFLNKLTSESTDKYKIDMPSKKVLDEKCTIYIFEFVLKNVIQKGNCYYLKTLNKLYSHFIQKHMEKEFGIKCSAVRVQNELLKKLLDSFPNEIKVATVKRQKVVLPKNLTKDNIGKRICDNINMDQDWYD